MKTHVSKLVTATLLAALASGPALARQDQPNPYSLAAIAAAEEQVTPSTFFTLMRSDVEGQKRLIVAQNLPMTEAEAAVFWPLHREYETELGRLNQQKFGLIGRYAAHYAAMTDRDANALAQDLFDLEEKNTDLKRAYFKKFGKVLPVTKAARYFQIEHQLNLALDLQVESSLPLIN